MSRSLRRTLVALLSFTLLVSIGATGLAQEPIVITFWKHSHPPADPLTEELIAEFEAANPGVDIQMG